jgi:hypothetical protein
MKMQNMPGIFPKGSKVICRVSNVLCSPSPEPESFGD